VSSTNFASGNPGNPGNLGNLGGFASAPFPPEVFKIKFAALQLSGTAWR
jgi:hypothetical protein